MQLLNQRRVSIGGSRVRSEKGEHCGAGKAEKGRQQALGLSESLGLAGKHLRSIAVTCT